MEEFKRFIEGLRGNSFPSFHKFIEVEYIDDRDTYATALKRMAAQHSACIKTNNAQLAMHIRDEIKRVYKMANTRIASLIYNRDLERLRTGGMPFDVAEREVLNNLSESKLMSMYLPALRYQKRMLTPKQNGVWYGKQNV